MAKIRDRTEDFKDAVHRVALSLEYSEVRLNFMVFSISFFPDLIVRKAFDIDFGDLM